MREIKFRYKAELPMTGRVFIVILAQEEIENGVILRYLETWVRIISRAQFTGLLDKNGKEIYDKDSLKITYPNQETIIGKVIWDFASWQIEGGGMLSNLKEEWVEIIGNIYESKT